MLPRIPLCSVEKLTNNVSPRMVRQLAQFMLGGLIFTVHIYEFVTLLGSAHSCIHLFIQSVQSVAIKFQHWYPLPPLLQVKNLLMPQAGRIEYFKEVTKVACQLEELCAYMSHPHES